MTDYAACCPRRQNRPLPSRFAFKRLLSPSTGGSRPWDAEAATDGVVEDLSGRTRLISIVEAAKPFRRASPKSSRALPFPAVEPVNLRPSVEQVSGSQSRLSSRRNPKEVAALAPRLVRSLRPRSNECRTRSNLESRQGEPEVGSQEEG
jgi:hypothetical protein